MKIHFYKFQGAGNDFIVIEGRYGLPELSQKEIALLCHRRFGIGADGLMTIGQSPHVDFDMRYYNADGKEGTLCGNGGRCIVAFAARTATTKRFTFSAIDGLHKAEVLEQNGNQTQVCLEMRDVDSVSPYGDDGYFLNTGSPHLVLFDTDIDKLDVVGKGAFWRHHPDFAPKGTNVNFLEVESSGSLFVRTYERGVEDETLACGTGVTASAIAAFMRSVGHDTKRATGKPCYDIRTLGGRLKVSFNAHEGRFSSIYLTGPATFVFEGDVVLPD